MASLKKQAIRATAWAFVGQFAGQFMRFGSNLVLARLLVPEYFGLMALANTFLIGLQLFSDIGIGPSIIQNKRGDDPDFINTAWTLQVIRGFGLWLASLLITWPIAAYYEEPQLKLLIPIVSLNAVINGFQSTAQFTLNRHLAQGKLTGFNLSMVAIRNIVTIVWAWLSKTIWAIVGGSLISSLLNTLFSHRLVPEISNRFTWEKTAAKEIFSFGKWIFVSTAMVFLAMQADKLILGRLFTLETLGVYSIALTLAALPAQAVGQISSKVIFPIISKLKDLPREKLRAKILQKRWLLLVSIAFGVAVLVSFGDVLILALYDEKYYDAAWMLPILALGLWPALVVQTITKSLTAIGKPIYVAWGNFLKFIYMVILLPFGFSLMGPLGAVIVIAFNDLPLYGAINYGLWQEKLTGIVQDIQATMLLIGLITILVTSRYYLGFGLPIDRIL
ncbi:MAG: oligosaccharide flippase family protein [Symploca sp. SIO2B6]|nr:oligosaccharide flippase family protein [Symploca sp. SIO2B6]